MPNPKNNGYRYVNVQISITQKEEPILYLLKENFGGKVYKKEKGCSAWRVVNKKEMWNFLANVTPHLIIKRAEAEIAMELLKGYTAHNQGRPLSKEELERRLALYGKFREERADPKAVAPSEIIKNL